MLTIEIGKRIESLRKEQKISIQDLAEKSGLSQQTYYNIVGNKTSINVDVLEKFAKALKVSVSSFFMQTTPFHLTEEDKNYLREILNVAPELNANYVIEHTEKLFSMNKIELMNYLVVESATIVDSHKSSNEIRFILKLILLNKELKMGFDNFIFRNEIVKFNNKEYFINDREAFLNRFTIDKNSLSELKNEVPFYLTEINEFVELLNKYNFKYKIEKTNSGTIIVKEN